MFTFFHLTSIGFLTPDDGGAGMTGEQGAAVNQERARNPGILRFIRD